MNRFVFFIIAFSILMGLAIGSRLPQVMERQAYEELSQRCLLSKVAKVEQKPEINLLADACIDWTVETVLSRYLANYRTHLKDMDLGQLSREANVLPRYKDYVHLVTRNVYSGQYPTAAGYAKIALELRPLCLKALLTLKSSGLNTYEQYDVFYREEIFADSLNSLGYYAEARNVMLAHPETVAAPSYCVTSVIANRQNRLAEAYLGLREYNSVIKELSKPIPNNSEGSISNAESDFISAFAYLSQDKRELAKEAFSRWEQKVAGPSEFELLLLKIPDRLDDAAANDAANKIINYFNRNQPDVTTPQCMDFSAAIMERYGHHTAAKLLFDRAHGIRQR